VQGQGPSGSAITMRELWPYALMFVLLVLMVEWYIYNKKVQI
jgi:hypothetical protein